MTKLNKILKWTIAITTTVSGMLGIILLAKGKELPDTFWEN